MKKNNLKKIALTALIMCFSISIWAYGTYIEYNIEVSDLPPGATADITATTSNPDVAVINSIGETKIIIESRAPGKATITINATYGARTVVDHIEVTVMENGITARPAPGSTIVLKFK